MKNMYLLAKSKKHTAIVFLFVGIVCLTSTFAQVADPARSNGGSTEERLTEPKGDIYLDLVSATALHGPISSVDVNGSGANTLKINLADVLPSTTLKVQGGSDDTVALFQSEGWSQSGTATDAGVVYNVWHNTSSTDQLLIDQHMHVTTA